MPDRDALAQRDARIGPPSSQNKPQVIGYDRILGTHTPRTAEWEAAYARALPGPDCASQLEAVQRWYDAGQRDQQQVRAVAFGTRPASAVEQSAGARATDPDWEPRLADALTAFRDCRWPLDYLRPAGAGT